MIEQTPEGTLGRWKARYAPTTTWGPSPRPSVIDLIVETQNEIIAAEEHLDSLHARLDYLEDYRTLKPFAEEEQNRLASRGNAIRTGEQRKQEFEIERLAERAGELRADEEFRKLELPQMSPSEQARILGGRPEALAAAARARRRAEQSARGREMMADMPPLSPEAKARVQESIEQGAKDWDDARIILERNAAEEPDLNGEKAKAARRDADFYSAVRSHRAQEEALALTARERALKNLAESETEMSERRGRHAAEEAPKRRESYQGDPEEPIESVDDLNAVGRTVEIKSQGDLHRLVDTIPVPNELEAGVLFDGERKKPWWRR